VKVRPHPIAGAAVGQLNTLLLALPLTYGPRGVRVNTVAPGATLTSGNAATSAVLDAMTATTPAGVVITSPTPYCSSPPTTPASGASPPPAPPDPRPTPTNERAGESAAPTAAARCWTSYANSGMDFFGHGYGPLGRYDAPDVAGLETALRRARR